MEFLLLISAVALVLGTVNGECNGDLREKCKTKDEENLKGADVCRKINFVRSCVLREAGCSEESANTAATEVDDKMGFKCKDNPKWEKEGRCITKEAKCEDEFTKTTQGLQEETNKDKICEAIGVFQVCAKSECDEKVYAEKIAKFELQKKIQRCENIEYVLCTDYFKYESCLQAFVNAKTDLDLAGDTETQCMLANALERCLRSKAHCPTDSIRKVLRNVLNTLDCSEYVDLCDHIEEEECGKRHSNPNNCEKLKEYRSCLEHNHTCPSARVHHNLRNLMIDQQIDCADVDTCEQKKEMNCIVDETQQKKTNEEKCKLYKQYQNCLVRANCNEKYMNSKIATVNDQLGKPCGASSILASIGLTLLLAAFTGQWK